MYIILVDWCSFPVRVWVSSVARSCATKDANNKDDVCKPSIPAGIKCPPPSKTISLITWFRVISTCGLHAFQGGRRHHGRFGNGGGGKQLPESRSSRRHFRVYFLLTMSGSSRSPKQLRKMMGVIVVVCAAFGLTVPEAKMEILCLRAKPESTATFSVEAAGQV